VGTLLEELFVQLLFLAVLPYSAALGKVLEGKGDAFAKAAYVGQVFPHFDILFAVLLCLSESLLD
jgi:hypothetical protein